MYTFLCVAFIFSSKEKSKSDKKKSQNIKDKGFGVVGYGVGYFLSLNAFSSLFVPHVFRAFL